MSVIQHAAMGEGAQAFAAAGLWATTAAEDDIGAPLAEDVEVGLCIVGGGVLGVTAALAAAEAGAEVLLCEAGGIGLGATGRSGGQIWAGFKPAPGELARIYGAEQGARLERIGAEAPALVFDLVERHQIRCHPDRRGTVVGVHGPSALPAARKKFEALAGDGQPVEWLDAAAMAAALGTDAYVAGWRHAAGGTVQPLAYVRGLARAAVAAGARLAVSTPVLGLEAVGGGWELRTPRALVRARAVLVATNGYSGPLVPGLARTVVPVESAQVATAPHPAVLEGRIMGGVACVSDTRRTVLYYRRSPDGRLVMGGRGNFLGGTSQWRFDRLRGRAEALFPELKGCDWTEQWSGKVAMTVDSLPHVHEPAPGLYCALGFNGRGMAMGTAFGQEMGRALAGAGQALPLAPLRPIPFHRLHRLGVAAIGTTYLLRDMWDERPRRA